MLLRQCIRIKGVTHAYARTHEHTHTCINAVTVEQLAYERFQVAQSNVYIMPWKGHPQSVHQTAQSALHFKPLADLFIMPWKGHPQSVHQTAQRALHFTPWQTCSFQYQPNLCRFPAAISAHWHISNAIYRQVLIYTAE